MKYKPEPITEKRKHYEPERCGGNFEVEVTTGWDVEFEENEGYIFEDQDDAMMFCLLLEIRDLLENLVYKVEAIKRKE